MSVAGTVVEDLLFDHQFLAPAD